jgi:predicted transcriptional regulator of viral defense system
MRSTPVGTPDWDHLFETAAAQAGYFTTKQAADAGYSTQLLRKHILAGRVSRPQRRIYRLVHFPAGDDETLVTGWLWTERAGVVSHQTALSLHGLSDVLPARMHLTLPLAWARRRLRVPPGIVLHHADIGSEDRTWHGPVPVTTVSRTLRDCARAGLSPEHLRQATRDALRRGLVTRRDVIDVEASLTSLGGLDE